MIVTAHQPNFLPGASVVEKIAAADAVIWLDSVQYTKGGYTNRNRLPSGEWITVPVERHCAFKPIREVAIGGPLRSWREPVSLRLLETWPGPVTERVCDAIARPYGLLVGLNAELLEVLLAALEIDLLRAWQSHLDSAHAVVATSDDSEELLPISDRLAMMVAELGGTVYLSGPSGRRYLNEEPFVTRGIRVDYFEHAGPNPCALELVRAS